MKLWGWEEGITGNRPEEYRRDRGDFKRTELANTGLQA